ncbi:MAG: glycosyl transferase, partial [Alphaproteobacteria bacterium]
MASAPLAVLQLCPALHEGGVERSTVDMALFLKTKYATPHVVSAGGQLVAELDAAHSPHHTLPLNRKHPFTALWCV